jgi:hypothetical protein
LPPIKIFFSKIPHKWGDMQPPIYGGWVDFAVLIAAIPNVFISLSGEAIRNTKKIV